MCAAAAGIAEQDRLRTPASFEVASIKPNTTGDRVVRVETYPGGRFVATNISLRSLVRLAYHVGDDRIAGGPPWMTSDAFDVSAVAAIELPPMNGPFDAGGALPDLLKSLLADRFGLAVHMEARDADIYQLVLARDDRRLGDGVKRSAIDCAALFDNRRPDAPDPACGVRIAPGSIVLHGIPISQLAAPLSGFVGRRVVDRTGLEGTYDLDLHWRREGPTLVTALQDAGLRLERVRAPQQTIVIDTVRQPSPN